ncbi:MAG: hypothetical protein RL594_189 [Bacteroidota bacterium]|jgi:hypothetical protein
MNTLRRHNMLYQHPLRALARGATAFICLFLATMASAQIRMQVMVRNPAPAQLSTWQRDPSVATITILNQGLGLQRVRLSIEIRSSSGRVVASTNDGSRDIPRFSLPGNGKITKLSGRDVLNTNAVTIDRSVYRMAAQTNSLPEGDYTCCVRLLDDNGDEVPNTTEACADVQIVIADPPALISPSQDQTVADEVIQFQWTPIRQSMSEGSVEYDLVVVPLLGKEQPAIAIERNERLLAKRIQRPRYLMTKMDRPLTVNGATRFAWRVRAVNADGTPCTSNNGYSEVGTFKLETTSNDLSNAKTTRPDTIVIGGFTVAVTYWNPVPENGTFSGRGCLVLDCDRRSSRSSSTSSTASRMRIPRYTWREYTVTENVTDTSRQMSIEQARQMSGGTFSGATISVPIRRSSADSTIMNRFSDSEAGKAIARARNCHAVTFEGVQWSPANSKKSTAISGRVTYPSESNIAEGLQWFPTDKFVVDVDTMQITPSGAVAAGSAYHVSATLGYGTGESGRFPFPLTRVSSTCEFVVSVPTPTDTMYIGESQCLIVVDKYEIDFSRSSSTYFSTPNDVGIGLLQYQTAPPFVRSIATNVGFLFVSAEGTGGSITDEGINARFVGPKRNVATNLHYTTIPVFHAINYLSLEYQFKNSQFMGGRFTGELYPDTNHRYNSNQYQKLVLADTGNRIDPDYTIRLHQTLRPDLPSFGLRTGLQMDRTNFAFTFTSSDLARVYGRYVPYWVEPKRWPAHEMPSTAELLRSDDYVGLLLTDSTLIGVRPNSPDFSTNAFSSSQFRRGRILLGPDGISGDVSYDNMILPARNSYSKVDLGRTGTRRYKSGAIQFLFYQPVKRDSDGKELPGGQLNLSFAGDVVTSTRIAGMVTPSDFSFYANLLNLNITSIGHVPAGHIMVDSARAQSNPWKLAIRPASSTQTSMGVVSPGTGVLSLSGATIVESVHFSKPFGIHAMEIYADGRMGRFALDHNCAGQTFDHFPIVVDHAQLSPVSVGHRYGPYLAVSGMVDFPFFGTHRVSLTNHARSDTMRPFLGRLVKTYTEPFDSMPATDTRLYKSDVTGTFDFQIDYNIDGQDGFIGKGVADLIAFATMPADITLRRDNVCFSAARESAPFGNMLLLGGGMTEQAWACACVKDDALSSYGAGGRLAPNANAIMGIVSGGVGLECTIGQHDQVATVWISGAAQLNALVADADARVMLIGVSNNRQGTSRGTIHLNGSLATIVAGLHFDAEVDFLVGMNSDNGLPMTYIQGAADVTAQAMAIVAGTSVQAQGGFFLGLNVPKRLAWVLDAEDARFRLQSSHVPGTLSGLYVYGGIGGTADALVAKARVDAHLGAGIFLGGATLVNAGVDLELELLGGLLSGGALVNLQVSAGQGYSGLYGRTELQGCVNTFLFGKYCTSVNVGVGMSEQRGLYLE